MARCLGLRCDNKDRTWLCITPISATIFLLLIVVLLSALPAPRDAKILLKLFQYKVQYWQDKLEKRKKYETRTEEIVGNYMIYYEPGSCYSRHSGGGI